jgi:hypothetical protein
VYVSKTVLLHATEAHLGDRRYSSCSFLTSALEGGEWSASRPGRALPPGKEPPVPTVQEAGWAPEPVWDAEVRRQTLWPYRESNLDIPTVVRHETGVPRLKKCMSQLYYDLVIGVVKFARVVLTVAARQRTAHG